MKIPETAYCCPGLGRAVNFWNTAVLACLAACSFPAIAGDIYRAVDQDGNAHYASQRLSPAYTLYISGGDTTSVPVPSRPAQHSPALDALILQSARRYQVDARLIRAVIEVESGYHRGAVSPAGAQGLMQLMPATATRYQVRDRFDPEQNIDGGTRYLKDLITLHDGNLTLALAAYNAGEGAVAKHRRRIPPYKETLQYVAAVLARLSITTTTTHPETNHD
jgi:soluble lytic murein transglycosylase-like protein